MALEIDLNGRLVLYCPDVDKLTPEVEALVRSVDLAILDATFYSSDELPNGRVANVPHPVVEDTVRKLADIAGRVIFTHFNHTNPLASPDSPQRRELEAQGFRFATDGDVID